MKKQKAKMRKSAYSGAFTIVEVVAALMIIALICSSVMWVVKRQIVALGESRLRMEAFEIARENMENLLTASSIGEMDDYGVSDKNPNIEWETVVEPFSIADSNKMWVQAVCSATYPDANGQPKTVELTHWLTDVPESVMKQIQQDQEKLKDINEPNLPADANGYSGSTQNPNTNTDNTQIDPKLKKLLEQLPRE
jgi:type II secretory pathway pseudopilin PulG